MTNHDYVTPRHDKAGSGSPSAPPRGRAVAGRTVENPLLGGLEGVGTSLGKS